MMKRTRLLVLGKSFPDLNNRDMEVMTTIACSMSGQVVRLFPIPLRYIANHIPYQVHDWIEAPVGKARQDARADTYNVMSKEIEAVGKITPNPGWMNIERYLRDQPAWQYPSMLELRKAYKMSGRSVGMVKVSAIKDIRIEIRPEEEQVLYNEKRQMLVDQKLLAPELQPMLNWVPYRAFVVWQSADNDEQSEETEITSWQVLRRISRYREEGAQRYLKRVLDPEKFDLRLLLTNTKALPSVYTVTGLWQPNRQDVALRKSQLQLF